MTEDAHGHRAGTTRLRIALPLLTLVPGSMGGSETYVRELARGLADREDVDLTLALPASAEDFVPGVRRTTASRVRGDESAKGRLLGQLAAEASRGVRRLARTSDLVHYPLTVPSPRPPAGRPFVQTLLDTQHHDLRQNFTRGELAYRRLRYDAPARKAAAVVTISRFCQRQITSHLGVPAHKVHVAHLGVDADQFKANVGDRQDFVLYPARGWPHKNHARLIEAMALVRETRPELRLVLTGGALDQLGSLPRWVEVRGLVSRDELLFLYQQAACLAFPSLYEGFGLPPLEAMASGCPVASADSGSLPEICGDAAATFDAHSPRSIADGILHALGRSAELQVLGAERVREFTWARCAEQHLSAYRAALDAGTGHQ